MKRVIICLLCALLLLTGCTLNINKEEVVKKEEKSQPQKGIVPSYQLSDENYRTILPYSPSKSRGVITNQVTNRVDIDEMEEGLRRLSKAYYDPDKYLFREGQNLTEDMLYRWLDRDLTKKQADEAVEKYINQLKEDKKTVNDKVIQEYRNEITQGLNPPIEDEESKEQQKQNPKYLTHILEQDFMVKNEDKTVKLAGMSIGIAMKSVYRFQTEIGGPYYYKDIDKEVMLQKGKEIAQTVLKRVRKIEGLDDVPIMIALYREEDQGSPVPGSYVAKTNVKGGDTTINGWKKVNEEHILFPSEKGEEKYFDDQQVVENFGSKIQDYFPNYVGVVGEGFYIDEDLKKLTLEIPIEFYGKGEVIGFTQYTYGLVKEMFADYYDLEVKIMSNKKMESLIYREAEAEKPTVHIFD